MINYILYIFIILILMTSCQSGDGYNEVQWIEDQVWSFDRILNYHFHAPDTSQFYDLVLTIQHDEQYRYQNLYTLITTHFPDGDTVEQMLSLQISDGKGLWLGKCSGGSCTVEINLQQGIRFPHPGRYALELKQHSRDDNLEGIQSVALAVIRAD
ncbi:MAG TPA: gliding motility lipoprotein GldH [Saprospiraceae bacterium]|nr:gliding motility lipoprotein GldH [Saprospiraceae bacterium]